MVKCIIQQVVSRVASDLAVVDQLGLDAGVFQVERQAEESYGKPQEHQFPLVGNQECSK